jgi:hypothetical protein
MDTFTPAQFVAAGLVPEGTRVRCKSSDRVGIVKPYEAKYLPSTFPVECEDGVWRKMTLRSVAIVDATSGEAANYLNYLSFNKLRDDPLKGCSRAARSRSSSQGRRRVAT